MTNTNLTVIVIEDEESLLEIIDRKLTEKGIDVLAFTKAEDALDSLKKSTKKIDVIWLDYHLKGMDGIEFMLAVKENPSTSNIPVIVVSNSANQSTINRLLELGAIKYLLKAENRLEDIVNTIKDIAGEKA